jgi:hypothetical protein
VGAEKRENGTEDRFGLREKQSEAIHAIVEVIAALKIVGMPINVGDHATSPHPRGRGNGRMIHYW